MNQPANQAPGATTSPANAPQTAAAAPKVEQKAEEKKSYTVWRNTPDGKKKVMVVLGKINTDYLLSKGWKLDSGDGGSVS